MAATFFSLLTPRNRRASMSLEFAVVGLALILFIFALLNLGLLGYAVASLSRGVQYAARTATVAAAANYAASSSYSCPTPTAIAGYFDKVAHPPLAISGIKAGSYPYVQANWYTNGTGLPPGVVLVLTVTDKWLPIGFPAFLSGMTIKITTVATVLGTASFSPTIDAATCDAHS